MKNIIKTFLCAGIAGGIALSANAVVIDGNSGLGFENPEGSGNVPDGWAAFGSLSPIFTDTVANGGQVFVGDQSVHIAGGSQGISRPVTLGESGTFEWMFYDDMATSKNLRVGLTRPGDNAPRFGAIGIDTGENVNHSETHYVWHQGFAFAPTSVERSEGWRHMRLEWEVVDDATEVEFYIDGVLGHTQSHASVVAIEAEFIGAPFPTDSGAWVDTIPEPSTYAAIFGGLALLGAFVYRRRRC